MIFVVVKDLKELDKLQLTLESKKEQVFRISSLSRAGLPRLINFLELQVEKQRNADKNISKNNDFLKTINSIWND